MSILQEKTLLKSKNAITHKLKCLHFYTPDSNFLSGRCYTPMLKPAGSHITLYQHQTAFSTCTSMLRMKAILPHKNCCSHLFPHFLLHIRTWLTYQVSFHSVAWFLNTGSDKFKLWSFPFTMTKHFIHNKLKKSQSFVYTYHGFNNVHKYIANPFSTNKSSVIFLFLMLQLMFLVLIVKQKYTSVSHQVPANQKYIQLRMIAYFMKRIHTLLQIHAVLKEGYTYYRLKSFECNKNVCVRVRTYA